MSARKHANRRGFSLIEGLVVMGILLVLASLMLPSIQMAREAARRNTCQARLSQIGQALHHHHATFGRFPYLAFTLPEGPRADTPLPRHVNYSIQMALLPLLDARSTFDCVNTDAPLKPDDFSYVKPCPENETAARHRLATFVCPSDPEVGGPWGPNSYRANHGTTGFRALPGGEAVPDYRLFTGPFAPSASSTAGQMVDGMAHTAFFSEKPISPGGPSFSRFHDYWWWGDWARSTDELVRACASAPATPRFWMGNAGHTWMLGSFAFTGYTHDIPPNSAIPDCVVHGDLSAAVYGGFTARSFHGNGVNVLYGDGHVLLVDHTIDAVVWRAAGTRAGAEVAK